MNRDSPFAGRRRVLAMLAAGLGVGGLRSGSPEASRPQSSRASDRTIPIADGGVAADRASLPRGVAGVTED